MITDLQQRTRVECVHQTDMKQMLFDFHALNVTTGFAWAISLPQLNSIRQADPAYIHPSKLNNSAQKPSPAHLAMVTQLPPRLSLVASKYGSFLP